MGNLLACSSDCSSNDRVEPIKYDSVPIQIDAINEDAIIDMLPLPLVNKPGSKRSTPSSSSGSDSRHEPYKHESPISKIMSAKYASPDPNQLKFNMDNKRTSRRRYSVESLPNIPQSNKVEESKLTLKILVNAKEVNTIHRQRNTDIYKTMFRRK